ncbi:MAG: hypothetical protein JSV21_01335 [Nitrospirota bacterium]|nr:MAG: hypothetical protein JSV21_01335 [Nitrospirota bacterium]
MTDINKKICPYCGFEMEANERVCASCLRRVGKRKANGYAAKSFNIASIIWIIIVGAILLGLLSNIMGG